jgi:hypothetical protein
MTFCGKHALGGSKLSRNTANQHSSRRHRRNSP